MNEVMEEKLLHLIYDYVSQNKELDENFANQVVEIAVSNLDLNLYVKKVEFIPTQTSLKINYAARYNLYEKIIEINLYKLIKVLLTYQHKYNFTTEEQVFFIFFSVSKVILHEIEHANQYKKIYTKDSSNLVERIILMISTFHIMINADKRVLEKCLSTGITRKELAEYIRRIQAIYGANYNYVPPERLAEYYAYKSLYNISKNASIDIANLTIYELHQVCNSMLKGYSDTSSPTKFYLDVSGNLPFWDIINIKSDGLNLEQKLALGLEVPKIEVLKLTQKNKELENLIIR